MRFCIGQPNFIQIGQPRRAPGLLLEFNGPNHRCEKCFCVLLNVKKCLFFIVVMFFFVIKNV